MLIDTYGRSCTFSDISPNLSDCVAIIPAAITDTTDAVAEISEITNGAFDLVFISLPIKGTLGILAHIHPLHARQGIVDASLRSERVRRTRL